MNLPLSPQANTAGRAIVLIAERAGSNLTMDDCAIIMARVQTAINDSLADAAGEARKAAINLCEVACCLWEAVDSHAILGNVDASPEIIACRDSRGTGELRRFCCKIADKVEMAWQTVYPDLFDAPFDWEFCPHFVTECIDWSRQGPVLRTDFMDIVKSRAAAWNAEFLNPTA